MFLVIITKETGVWQQQILDKILIFAKIYEAGKTNIYLHGCDFSIVFGIFTHG